MGELIFIIAGGPVGVGGFLASQIRELRPARLVCADGGARHLRDLDLIPQVVIGDMDSLDADTLEHYQEKGSLMIRRPGDKKETDTQLALEYALEAKPGEIRIYGGLGGRLDHTLANISLLVKSADAKVPAKLVDEWCEAFVITGRQKIVGMAGQTVSLFPLSSLVSGIELEGFVYPLKGGSMKPGDPYGISNKLALDRGSISIASGYLLVVRYHRPDVFPPGE